MMMKGFHDARARARIIATSASAVLIRRDRPTPPTPVGTKELAHSLFRASRAQQRVGRCATFTRRFKAAPSASTQSARSKLDCWLATSIRGDRWLLSRFRSCQALFISEFILSPRDTGRTLVLSHPSRRAKQRQNSGYFTREPSRSRRFRAAPKTRPRSSPFVHTKRRRKLESESSRHTTKRACAFTMA